MNQFGRLYYYEMKKLLKRKIVWIALLIGIIAVMITILGELIGYYYIDNKKIDTKYHMYLTDRDYQKKLEGRAIDQSLLEEMTKAYRKIPITAEHYSVTEEYQTYARPYSVIFSFVQDTTQMTRLELTRWIPELKDLYTKRQAMLEEHWQSEFLSDGEVEFWRQKEAKLKWPFVYQITESYEILLSAITTVGLLVLLIVSVCLSSLFMEEHTRKTDQLILCSKFGKNIAYWAKFFAGISFATGTALLLLTFAVLLAFGAYGIGDFNAMIQLVFAQYSYSLTAGQMVLILYGCVLATTMVYSALIMLLSEMCHNSIATLAITSGMLIFSMIGSVPFQYRVLSQIWNWLPSGFLAPWNIFDVRLLLIFGHYFTAWQAVPAIDVIASFLLAFIGKPIYQQFQISGR